MSQWKGLGLEAHVPWEPRKGAKDVSTRKGRLGDLSSSLAAPAA